MGESSDELFSDDYLRSLPEEAYAKVASVCEYAVDEVRVQEAHPGWSTDDDIQKALVPAHQFVKLLNDAYGLDLPVDELTAVRARATFDVASSKGSTSISAALCVQLVDHLETIKRAASARATESGVDRAARESRERFASRLLGKESPYLARTDVRRIQSLLAKLREEIASSEQLEERHRSRLLSRVDSLQDELDQPVSRLDRFLGGLVRFGTALGLAGKEAKPFFDTWREIKSIASAAEAEAIGWEGHKLPQLMLPEAEDESSPPEDPAADSGIPRIPRT